MNLEKAMKEANMISKYKKDYNRFSVNKNTRNKVSYGLYKLIESYQPFVKQVTSKAYSKNVDFDLERHWQIAEKFVNEHFSEEVYTEFKDLPSLESEGEVPNLTKTFLRAYSDMNGVFKYKNRDKTVQQEKYLKYLYECLNDYGLHPNIQNRPVDFYGRYWISISHKFERKNSKRVVICNLTKAELVEQYVTPYLERTPQFLDGQNVPFSALKAFKITRLLLTEDEIPLFKAKHRISKDTQLFDKALDVTNEFVNTKKVNQNYTLSKEILEMVHPKFQVLIKSKFRIHEYGEAVSAVFKELNNIVKEEYKTQSGSELDGIALISRVFSGKSGKNPFFIFPPDLTTENNKNEQEGYQFLFRGVITGIRNPHAHKNFNLEPKDAIYKIIMASHLLYKFENRSQ